MKSIFLTGLTAGLFLALVGIANATGFSYSYTVNGGTPVAITPLSGAQSANAYYDYYGSSGHPSFGTEKSTAFFWLWEDTTNNNLSLNVIFNKPGLGGTGGIADFTLSGLPSGWSWTLEDDGDNVQGSNDLTPTWIWIWLYTDGGVIGGLEHSEWNIVWDALSTSNNFTGISSWYFLTAGADKFSNSFLLSPGSTLTVSAAPIPEPTTMLLMSTGLIVLAGARRKKKI